MPQKPRPKKGPGRKESKRLIERQPKPSKDSVLMSVVDEIEGERILCSSLTRAPLAAAIADRLPESSVVCFYLDIFLAEQARQQVCEGRPNLSIVCETDLPAGEFDTVAFPFLKQGEAELTRELMQQGYERLKLGGKMFVSTNNPRDKWIKEQLEMLFDKVATQPHTHGLIYSATKTESLKRVRDFTAEFAFRDGERIVKAISRPSVFSHRELDVGSRALLEATLTPTKVVRAGMRILDIGCGAGTVGIALALRASRVHVHAVDSNPRALQCTIRSAELNGLRVLNRLPKLAPVVFPTKGELSKTLAMKAAAQKAATEKTAAMEATAKEVKGLPKGSSASDINGADIAETDDTISTLSTQLDAEGLIPLPGTFDLVLANPPYYSNWAIAKIFVEAAARALKPGGKLFLVTKNGEWYLNNLPFVLTEVAAREVRDYVIITAKQRTRN
jgi:16S rRNA (guanine1207-N2)-methyltransferase